MHFRSDVTAIQCVNYYYYYYYYWCRCNHIEEPYLKNRAWRPSSWTFNWKSLYKKFRRPRDATCELGHWTSSITLFPILYSLSPVYYNFHSYDILPYFLEYSDLALGSVLLCVLRHTIMTSPTCALTQLFVPDNHRQGCPRRHLKWNTCVRSNFKHTHFNLFRARLIK